MLRAIRFLLLVVVMAVVQAQTLRLSDECILELQSNVCSRLSDHPDVANGVSMPGVSYLRFEKTGSSSVYGQFLFAQRSISAMCQLCVPFMPQRGGDHSSLQGYADHGVQALEAWPYIHGYQCAINPQHVAFPTSFPNAPLPAPFLPLLYVTVLRDPLEKYMSSYFYFSHKNTQLSVNEFDATEAFSNPILAYLATRYTQVLGRVINPQTWADSTDAQRLVIAEHGCVNLKNDFDIVGLTKDLGAFSALVAQRLSLPSCLFPKLRSNDAATTYDFTTAKAKMSSDTLAIIHDFLQWDTHVYQCAIEVHTASIEALPEDYLREFRRVYDAGP